MTDQYEEQKSSSGGLASIVFLVTALYLFFSGPGFGSVFSLKGALFLGVGMFAAAIVIGMPAYFLQCGIARGLTKIMRDSISSTSVIFIGILGVFLMIAQIVVTAWLTKIAFGYLLI